MCWRVTKANWRGKGEMEAVVAGLDNKLELRFHSVDNTKCCKVSGRVVVPLLAMGKLMKCCQLPFL